MRPNLPTNHPETQYRRHNNKQWWRRYSHCTTKIKLSAGDHIPSLNTFERNCCWPLEANACKQQACVQPWQEVIFCAVSQSKWQVVGQHSLPTSQLWSGWFQGPELSEELLEALQVSDWALAAFRKWVQLVGSLAKQGFSQDLPGGVKGRSCRIGTDEVKQRERCSGGGEELLRWSFAGSQQRCCFNSGSSSGAVAVSGIECMTRRRQPCSSDAIHAKSDQSSSVDIPCQVTCRSHFCETFQSIGIGNKIHTTRVNEGDAKCDATIIGDNCSNG